MTNPKVPIPVMTEYGRGYFVYTSMEEELRHEFEHLKYISFDDLRGLQDAFEEQRLPHLSKLVEEVFHQYRKRREDWRRIERLGRLKFWRGLTMGVAFTALSFFVMIWWKTHV